ncbi:MAG: PilZ domain-containing protein [Nitrospirota bacterium]
MIRLECPACRKDSYSASVRDFRQCPYCRTFFSGKYGIEKRRDARVSKDIPVVLSYHEKNLSANLVDISVNGVSIRIPGNEYLPVGEIIHLNIRDSSAEAQVKWIINNDTPSVTMAGFRIVNGQLNP